MESVLESYYEKYSIPESGKKELIEIFNRSLLDISEGIMRNRDSSKTLKTSKTSKSSKVSSVLSGSEPIRKFASKKAEDYALENELSLSDFNIAKVSKKDVEELIRVRTKKGLSPKRDKIESKSAGKIMCSGLTKKGEVCNKCGTHKPELAKKFYCFRHSEDWKSFECDSDSSDSDTEEELNEKSKEELNEKSKEELNEKSKEEVKDSVKEEMHFESDTDIDSD